MNHQAVLQDRRARSIDMPFFLRFSALARVAILCPATATAAMTVLAPTSLTAMIAGHEGPIETLMLALMIATLAVGWADFLVNDVLPARFRLRWARQQRWLGFALLGAMYFVKAFAAGSSPIDGAAVVMTYYFAQAITCAWFTWACVLRPFDAL